MSLNDAVDWRAELGGGTTVALTKGSSLDDGININSLGNRLPNFLVAKDGVMTLRNRITISV